MTAHHATRRTVLAGAAALPVAAITAAAPALAGEPMSSATAHAAALRRLEIDAELIALGPELEIVVRAWLSQQKLGTDDRTRIDAEVERLTGIKVEDAPPYRRADKYWKVYDVVEARLDIDVSDENDPWNEIHGRLYPLVDRILALRAATAAGLAIQARAASLANADLWNDVEPGSQDSETKGFIESVCEFLGVVPVPKELGKAVQS
jgi:hypothetical protein